MAGFSFEEIPQRHVIAEHHEKVIDKEEVKITVEKVHPISETPYCDQNDVMINRRHGSDDKLHGFIHDLIEN